MKELHLLMSEIKLIKQVLFNMEQKLAPMGDWLPKKDLLRYFDYSDNQLRQLEKNHSIIVSKIGRRKFYSVKSIIDFLENNIQ